MPDCIKPYFTFRDELAIVNGLILEGDTILIPKSLCEQCLKHVHKSHMGITKTLARACTSVFWPDIGKDITNFLSTCSSCAKYQDKQQKEPYQMLDTNTTHWSSISLDNFEFKGNKYLMILDTCTKFIIVCKSDHFDTASTTKILNSVFSEHGIPSSIRCDMGSNFLSDLFRHYAKVLNIDLSYSSTYHHSSNPAECAICTVKNLMKQCYHANESWRLALLEYLSTTLDSNLTSPSELNGRQFSGLLPNLRCNSLPDSTSEALIDRHKKQLNCGHGKGMRDLPEGSTVSYYDHTVT